MLTIWGNNWRPCDGINRREFLKFGALGGILSLADLLRLRAVNAAIPGSTATTTNKSVIMLFLMGGPPHIDTYDPKPSAPAEYRGEFKPIRTRVPGIEISELFPRHAAIMDKLALIRSVVARPPNGHGDSEIVSGFNEADNARDRHPSFGAVVSRLRGTGRTGVPPFVSLRKMTYPNPGKHFEYDFEPGYLGTAHRPLLLHGSRVEEVVNSPGVADLRLPAAVDRNRLGDRQHLLASFDQMRRDLDAYGTMRGLDAFQSRAFEVMTSSALRQALDLSKEDPRVRECYGTTTGEHGHGGQLLLARRLVEAGVGFVSLSMGDWDTHADNFNRMRRRLGPMLDQALTALVEDLHQRGMDKDVVVVVWGEFGRTPRINKDAGRDHWLPVMSALVTGGGLKTGQVIGATDSRGEYPKERPYSISQVLSTVYRTIGIDPAMTFPNGNGRPMYLLDDREPIRELL